MKKYFILFILFFIISVPVAAFAEQALVPQSGQTVCYDAAGVEIPCTGTGQDADQQMGIAWPNPRFTDNSNGTITDNLTGLIWLKNAGCFNNGYPVNPWSSALSAANALANGTCGLSDGSVAGDWRLPNKKELESLINRQQVNPASWLNTVGFSNVNTGSWGYPYDSYWTSSTIGGSAWSVYLLTGTLSYYDKGSYPLMVWPVRGGQ